MSIFENIYDRVPICFQNLMVSTKGYLNSKDRYGKEYYKELLFLREFDKWELDRQLLYQQLQLRKFLHYAVNNSPFYRELYKGIDIDSIKSVDDLRKLPIVDKEMLRKNIDHVVTVSGKNVRESHTGGTTGKSLVVKGTIEDGQKRMAMLDHFKERVGFRNLEMRRATFNGKHIVPPNKKSKVFWRYNAPVKQMIYSSFHITEENCKYYVASLNEFKPEAIDGFFTSICDIANYIERHNCKLKFQTIAIFPTSETLTEAGRNQIERVFKAKVYDQYASSEGAPFITECVNQNPHIELASGVFEHFIEGSDEILVTSFTTHGTPLIRYRIGDSVTFSNEHTECGCGLHSPIVKQIQGRSLDYLYTADGAKINSGNIANLFKNISNAIIRAQLIQDKMDSILIKLEIDQSKYIEEYDDLLEKEFLHKFGSKTLINIQHVEKIEREKSGKFRMVVNNVHIS